MFSSIRVPEKSLAPALSIFWATFGPNLIQEAWMLSMCPETISLLTACTLRWSCRVRLFAKSCLPSSVFWLWGVEGPVPGTLLYPSEFPGA